MSHSCVCTASNCEHEFVPTGFLGPYPVEECIHCNAGSILDTPGYPPAFDVITDRLRKLRCDLDDEREGW